MLKQMSHSMDARRGVAGDNHLHLVHAHCNSDNPIGCRGLLGLDSILKLGLDRTSVYYGCILNARTLISRALIRGSEITV